MRSAGLWLLAALVTLMMQSCHAAFTLAPLNAQDDPPVDVNHAADANTLEQLKWEIYPLLLRLGHHSDPFKFVNNMLDESDPMTGVFVDNHARLVMLFQRVIQLMRTAPPEETEAWREVLDRMSAVIRHAEHRVEAALACYRRESAFSFYTTGLPQDC